MVFTIESDSGMIDISDAALNFAGFEQTDFEWRTRDPNEPKGYTRLGPNKKREERKKNNKREKRTRGSALRPIDAA